MRRSMLGLAVAAMLALSLAPGVSAQAPYTIDGAVLDQDGEPVAGANVSWYQYGDEVCEETVASDDPAGPEPARACTHGDHHQEETTTDAEGRFSVSARQGWGNLQVWKEGHASHYDGFDVSGDRQIDVELLKFPEKTARLEGRITPGASISIENPVYGTYECSQPEGTGEPKPEPRTMEPAIDGGGSDSSEGNTSMTIAPGEPYPGCAITVRADGSYAGNVTPGYSIIRVHGGWTESGESHYSHSTVRDLPADATTRLDVALQARPGPDADLSGYVVDGATQTAIPGAQVSFSNQDGHGWASAQTDGDGSYKVALRSGFVHIQVWADGYLPWEGQVELASGAQRSLDIVLTAGQARYGGCCIAYAGDADAPSLASDGEKAAQDEAAGRQSDDAGTSNGFEDFGGGLGPYDPARADAEAERESPGMEVFAFIALLCLLAFFRRR